MALRHCLLPTHVLRVEGSGLRVLQDPPQAMEVRLDGDHVLLDVLRGHELLTPAAVLGGRGGGRGRRPDLLSPPARPHVKALRRRHRRRRRRRRRRPGRSRGPDGVDLLVVVLLPTARLAAEPRHEKIGPEIETEILFVPYLDYVPGRAFKGLIFARTFRGDPFVRVYFW